MCTFGRGYYEEQFCEIILNLDQWFLLIFFEFGPVAQEMSLKDFLSGALAPILFGGAEQFMHFGKRASWGRFM